MIRLWRRRKVPGNPIAERLWLPHGHGCSACGRSWQHRSADCLFDQHDRARVGEPFFGLCESCRRDRHLYFPLYLELVAVDRQHRADDLREWARATGAAYREARLAAVAWAVVTCSIIGAFVGAVGGGAGIAVAVVAALVGVVMLSRLAERR